MNKNIWKSKWLWIGIVFFVGLVVWSVLFSVYDGKEKANYSTLMYGENGKLIATSPYTPMEKPPFGSDRSGMSLGYKIVDGAKYTISIVFITVTLQIICSISIGFFLAMYIPKSTEWIRKFFNAFYYVPTIVWVIVFSIPVFMSMDDSNTSMITTTFKQMLVFVAVFLPTVSLYICNEVVLFMKEDYVVSARLLGASKWHLIKIHIFPSLRRKLFVLYIQQCTQVMMLLVQLGFFDFFIGGRRETSDMMEGTKKFLSLSNEWSGLIGGDKTEIWLAPWILLAPLCMFAFSIFILNMMMDDISKGLVVDENSRGQQMKTLLTGNALRG